jgi:hypothetical protein
MALTDSIEAHVAAADWAAAAELDGQRRQLLDALFTGEPDIAHNEAARQVLQKLRARTEATTTALADTQRTLSGELQKLDAAPQAVRAYQNHARQGP